MHKRRAAAFQRLCLYLAFAFAGALKAAEALAAGGSGASGAEAGIPLKILLIQLVNFTPFALLLFFLLKKPVSRFYAERKRDFLKMEKQALEEETQARAARDRQKELLKEQINREKTAKAFALKEGERFKRKKALEIKEAEASFEREKRFFIRLEEEKAHADILKNLTGAISKAAAQKLRAEGSNDKGFHQRLRRNFLSQSGAAKPKSGRLK